MRSPALDRLIDLALEEDLGRGDVTSEAIFEPGTRARGAIVAKQELVLAGVEAAREVFRRVDAGVRFEARRADGEPLERGDAAIAVEGEARSILAAERIALNFLQHLSGIATLTRAYVR